MIIVLLILTAVIFFFQFRQIRNLQEEVSRLWKYGVHLETVLRDNDLWVNVDDKGNPVLAQRWTGELNAEAAKEKKAP